MKTVVVTGSDGFIGRNLCVRLAERDDCEVIRLGRHHTIDELTDAAQRGDFIYHLAGINRPQNSDDFETGNIGFTQTLVDELARLESRAPIVFTSSTQAALDNPYGNSKRSAEMVLEHYSQASGVTVHLIRLPNVFGKWSRPNYNSAVVTFCYNIARGLPITVNDESAPMTLAYVEDVVEVLTGLLDVTASSAAPTPLRTYNTTVGAVANTIRRFHDSRKTLLIDAVGTGLTRALYSTYLSYLPPDAFAYETPIHGRDDPRGIFVEMLKTPDHGQFSYFIARPGVTRGDHYHHSKNEKFLVISGTARFAFRNIITGEEHSLIVVGGSGKIVETAPGWTHNIQNVGETDLACMLWANEIFDAAHPDTIAMKV